MKIDVDFCDHPAFSAHRRRSDEASALDDAVRKLDAAVAQASGTDDPAVKAALAEIGAAIEADPHILSDFKPFVASAFSEAAKRTCDEIWRRRRVEAVLADAPSAVAKTVTDFHEKGYARFNLSAERLARLREVVAPDVEHLRQRGAERSDDIAIAPPQDHEAYRIVNDHCREIGLFDAISAYYGEPHSYAGFVIHVSQPRDTWFHVYDDIGAPMPKTAQMHFDQAFQVPKSMLYLNDVGVEQGPFSLVPKSDPWQYFGADLALRKEMLFAVQRYVGEVHKRQIRDNMSAFRFVEARAAIASLPKCLRQTGHPGDAILDGTRLSDQLLAAEHRLDGEAGSMPVFTGGHVLHRGGLVARGERIALQVVFPPDSAAAAAAAKAPAKQGFFKSVTEKLVSVVRREPRA